MKQLSSCALKVQDSPTLALNALAKQMEADGLDIVGFGAGEPDFDTPDNIKAVGITAIRDGQTKYTPASGLLSLKKAVAHSIKRDFGADYDPSQIVIGSGAKHIVFLAMLALLEPGDEVIIPAPYWVSYTEMVRLAAGKPVIVDTTAEQNFKITPKQLDDAITDRTKAVVINNPSNPTGIVYDKEELKALADVCVKRDVYIISDEIYYHLLYDGITFTSMSELGEEIKERTILVNGVSKTYAMTGWRVGYSASNKEIAKVMANCLSHTAGAPGTMNQYAAIEAYEGPQEGVEEMRKVFEERRDYICARMNAIDGISCVKPSGAFYVFMSVEGLIGKTLGGRLIKDGDDFAMAFLEKALVAVVPGSGFGCPNCVRWTYATSIENIKEGLDRLEKFVKEG